MKKMEDKKMETNREHMRLEMESQIGRAHV